MTPGSRHALMRVLFTLMLLVVSLLSGMATAMPETAHGAPVQPGSPSNVLFDDDDEGDDDDDDDDKPGKSDKNSKENKNKGRVEALADYTVLVTCEFDDANDRSVCAFTAQGPKGKDKVKQFVVPGDVICTTVLEGRAEIIDLDAETSFSGFLSENNKTDLTLILDGEVTVGEDEATYWFEADKAVFPAQGESLDCGRATNQPASTSTAVPETTPGSKLPPITLTPSVSDSTGEILVRTQACPVAAPADDYDWFGECGATVAEQRFQLAGMVDTTVKVTAATDTGGQARFGNLDPGTYKLTLNGGDWCHAESDAVDDQGQLVVSAGERATVWIFTCPEADVSPTVT